MAPVEPRIEPLTVPPAYRAILPRCVSGATLRSLHSGSPRSSHLIAAAAEIARWNPQLANQTLLDFLLSVYAYLKRWHRSDYVYRSAITTKVLLGRHSPRTARLLPEFRVWQSKADLVLLNGTSTVYEIKTDYDNLDRLPSQLTDYLRVFDEVYVVAGERNHDAIERIAPRRVGILSLSRRFTLHVVRVAESNVDNVDIVAIVDALRRAEIVAMTRDLCGTVPDVGTGLLHGACRELLERQSPQDVHGRMVALLKQRRAPTSSQCRDAPRPLLASYMASGVPPTQWRGVTASLAATPLAAYLLG